MKNYIKYISLGAATLLLGSYCEASLIEDLNEANVAFKALNDTPDNWKTVAQQFVDIFNDLEGQLLKLHRANGGNPKNIYIDTISWEKNNKVIQEIFVLEFLHPDIKAEIMDKYPRYEWIKQGMNRFKKLGKLLKQKIVECLGKEGETHKKLKFAGERWDKDFIKPVGQLLNDHSREMGTDVKTLQLLLNLQRCYFLSGLFNANENFKEIRDNFFDSLADTVLGCNEYGEKRDILYAILTTENGVKVNNKQYYGYLTYWIDHESLSNKIQDKKGFIQPKECMAGAIDKLKIRVDNEKNPQQPATINPEAERLREDVHSQIMHGTW